MTVSRSTIDFLLFNACWMANLYGALYSFPLFGGLVTVASVTIHLLQDSRPGRELVFLVGAALFGFGWDTFLQKWNFMVFPLSTGIIPPVWLLIQWFAFGIIIRDLLKWLRTRYVLAAVLGATGGPLSYFSASRFGVLELTSPSGVSAVTMGLGWALLIPFLQYMYSIGVESSSF